MSPRRPPLAGAASPGAPRVLERYALIERLGTGAFGTVWLARDERLEREVAVKILAREFIATGRFEREARAAARLSHPGIVTLYEAAVDDDGAYLVSELVRGDTLGTLLAEGALSDRDVLTIGAALADALEHAHEHGVVHRDVKPSNVLVPTRAARSAARLTAKLTDFGVARVTAGGAPRGAHGGLTLTGDIVGTLNYMAPEQAAGLEAGEPADLFALALVLYEALTGVNPLRGIPARMRTRRAAAHLPPIRRQRRDLPRALGDALDRALRLRPDERGTIAELRAALAPAHDHVGADPGVVAGPLRRLSRDEDEDEDDSGWWRARASAPPRMKAAPGTEPGDPSRLIWQARALAASATAGLAVWLAHEILRPGATPALPLALTGFLAGTLVLILPRVGFLATCAYLCLAAVVQGATGAALVIAAGVLAATVVLPASPALWPVATAAPGLGFIGIAGAWPALAGYARRPWRRLMLGALGWLWLSLAGPLDGRTLYARAPRTIPPRAAWDGSATHAAMHVLEPLARSGALAPAAAWDAAAMLVPWIVGRRSALVTVGGALAWAAALTAAPRLAVAAVHGSPAVARAPDAVAGGLAAAAFALLPLAPAHGGRAVGEAGLRERVP